VHETLKKAILVEGYPFCLDIEKSHGQYLHDAVSNRDLLDFFTFYASRPVRFDHPMLLEPEYLRTIELAARTKPSNGDVYTLAFAEFVDRFRRTALGPGMKYLFFVDGGALAVENALKCAFDWKVQKNLAAGKGERGTNVIHFEQAFHGRSGYTVALTNTNDQRKTRYFPKFDWPRVPAPALCFPVNAAQAEEAEARALKAIDAVYEKLGQDEICSIIIEPIQCEGGDRYFRPQFFQALRKICDEREALLIFDEVQTGMGVTGTMWYYEQLGIIPDVLAFAKKAQTGGIMAGARLDEIDSVFKVKSRISSTFGGNLVDFVRATRILEIMEAEHLLENAKTMGAYLLSSLSAATSKHERISNLRGAGLLAAFDLPDTATRDKVISKAQDEALLILSCGDRSVRLRPALDVGAKEVDLAVKTLSRVFAELTL
jgi:L-lysine 6-transaminase